MSIETDLQQFISEQVVLDGEIALNEPLISSGKVDSLGLLQILGYIEQTYGVTLLTSSDPKDFASITALADAVRKACDKSGSSVR